MRLVALELIENGRGVGATWINPEHITSVQPRAIGRAPAITLDVLVKLEGLPLFTHRLGVYQTGEAYESAWGEFLALLTQHPPG